MRDKTKLIQGWGINDVMYEVCKVEKVDGKKKIVWTCPYYKDWKGILQRCISKNFHENNPTYTKCSVCEDWKYLSNFIKWVDEQPNRDWQDCQLDKDLLVEGNKHYSPETCIYIPRSLNSFITDAARCRGKHMIGVNVCASSKRNPFMAQCCNYFIGKQEYLGLYPTELEAHLAWKAKKHKFACMLADLQEDERVAKRLREMYSEDQDWTNK